MSHQKGRNTLIREKIKTIFSTDNFARYPNVLTVRAAARDWPQASEFPSTPAHTEESGAMENYSKGKNVEEPLCKDKLPIPNLPNDFLWMQVQGGSKMRNLLELALKEYADGKDVLWTGSGAAVGKVISCAEILKRKFKGVHQFNKIQYRRCEEYWDPKLEGLDQLVVHRDVPMIHILLTHEPVNADLPGYQDPNKEAKPRGSGRQNRPKKHSKPNISPQVENAGLVFNKGKPKKNLQRNES